MVHASAAQLEAAARLVVIGDELVVDAILEAIDGEERPSKDALREIILGARRAAMERAVS